MPYLSWPQPAAHAVVAEWAATALNWPARSELAEAAGALALAAPAPKTDVKATAAAALGPLGVAAVPGSLGPVVAEYRVARADRRRNSGTRELRRRPCCAASVS